MPLPCCSRYVATCICTPYRFWLYTVLLSRTRHLLSRAPVIRRYFYHHIPAKRFRSPGSLGEGVRGVPSDGGGNGGGGGGGGSGRGGDGGRGGGGGGASGLLSSLTAEQRAIVLSDVKAGEVLTVLAFAGTGKTTCLRAYAQARPHLRILYLTVRSTF